MYNIWYGKRTGSNIGKPDKWNQFGPVDLAGGKFYVFDVTSANLGEANPQMINSMLSNPTSGESVVWFKLSTEDAYVVCFEGPLGEGLQLSRAWKMSGHQDGFNDWKADLNLKREEPWSGQRLKGQMWAPTGRGPGSSTERPSP